MEQPLPSRRVQILHVFVLSAFAVAQPLFDLLGRNASFFVAHRAGRGDVVLLVLAALTVVPLVLVAVRLVIERISARAGRIAHLTTVGVLLSCSVTAVFPHNAGVGWAVMSVGALAIAALGAWVYAKAAVARRFVSVLAIVLVVFPALFLASSQVRAVTNASKPTDTATGATSDVPVMTVLFDELSLSSIVDRNGRLDADRFPNFARLSRTSTWYRNATTSGLRTDQAVPAILTGSRPRQRQVPSSFAYPDSVFTMLAPTHRMHVHEFVSQVCPPDLCEVTGEQVSGLRALFTDAAIVYGHIVLPDDLAARWLPPLGDRWAGFTRDGSGNGSTGDPVRDWLRDAIDERETQHEGTVFERFLRQVKPGSKPQFSWLHVQVPHPPWRYLPDGRTYPAGDSTPGYKNFTWSKDQYLADEVLQRSLLQARFADVLLGRLLDHLEQTDQLDDMMLSVIADHGATWEAGQTRRNVDGPQGAALLGVPMFVKYPDQHAGVRDTRDAETVDLVPTIAAVTGAELGFDVDGISLLERGNGHRVRTVFDGSEQRRVNYDFDDTTAMAKHIEELFGDGDLFAFGPHRDLMGERGDDLDELAVRFDREPYEDVDTKAGELPVFLRGVVTGDAPLHAPVVAVLNGYIAGVGQTYEEDGRMRVAMILSPEYLRDGKNTISVRKVA